MNVKILERAQESRGHLPTVRCEAEGCDLRTREGKPYCPQHVEHHPYVQRLLVQLAEREAEEEQVRLKGPRAVDMQGIAAQEILQFLRIHGDLTVPRLARELNMDVDAVAGYVKAFKREKLVHLGSTRRGAILVHLGPKPAGSKSAGSKSSRSKAKAAQPADPARPRNGGWQAA